MKVRVRLGAGLNRFTEAPNLALELPEGATVADLLAELGAAHAQLAPALRSALPVCGGVHVERARMLADGEEVALLMPVAGGG